MPSADKRRSSDPDPYRGYMLRLWKETPDAPWQGQLECTTTGQHYHFTSLDRLIAFLRDEESDPSGGEGGGQNQAARKEVPPSSLLQQGPARSQQGLREATLASVFHETSAYPQLASVSLLEATSFEGGEDQVAAVRLLLRAAAPAVLYASHTDVSYPYTYGQLVARVNAALASGDRAPMLALAEELEADNQMQE